MIVAQCVTREARIPSTHYDAPLRHVPTCGRECDAPYACGCECDDAAEVI